jgi:hypothetical protein
VKVPSEAPPEELEIFEVGGCVAAPPKPS